MDRGWYLRLGIVVACCVAAWFALWPSLGAWVPAPSWVKHTFPGRIAPGLDIQGGLRLMYEVEVDVAISDRRGRVVPQIEERLGRDLGTIRGDESPEQREIAATRRKLRVTAEGDRRLRVAFTNQADLAKLDRRVITSFGDLREVSREGKVVVLEIRDDRLEQIRETAVDQAIEVISNRIDELQVRETNVSKRENDIVVEIPGADQATFDRIREIIARTARLEFRIVQDDDEFIAGLENLPEGITRQSENVTAGEGRNVVPSYLVTRGRDARQKLQRYVDQLAREGRVPDRLEILLGELEEPETRRGQTPQANRPTAWRTWLVQARADVTGDSIDDAFVAFDSQKNGEPYVAVNFNGEGAEKFKVLTGANVKRRMAIVLDSKVASAPNIQSEIGGGHCQITLGGMRSQNEIMQEAKDLVVVLRAGALPAPIRPSNEQLIGPTLGRDSIQEGAIGALVGVVLVLLFMGVYYEVAGVVADIAVVMNLLFLFAVLAAFEATLTLPGIAGIALTVGMAVDANVLITERIREELRAGKSPRAAVDQGFGRAFWSIVDSQITTLISGIVLFQYGTGPIKGFAVTLIIGILCSLFTGIFCSRVMMDWLVRGLRVQRLRVG